MAKWQAHDKRLYGHAAPTAIHRFETDTRPIRVWHNVTHESPGAAVSATDVPGAGIGQQFAGARATQSYSASRLVYTEVRVFASSIAVLDLTRLQDVPIRHSAPTLGSRPRPDRSAVRFEGVETVLSLVGPSGINPSAPTVMTAWIGLSCRVFATDARVTTSAR
jgi:hypothetical protein